MEIKSSPGSRFLWTALGLGLSGAFLVGVILASRQSGPNPVVTVLSLFPIGLGIVTYLWLGRPAWVRVGTTEVTYVPPLGSAKVFPRSLVKQIVRIPRGRGTSIVQFRDQDNHSVVSIEQGFARADMEKLAGYLDAKFTWDLDWKMALPAGATGNPASREQALQEMMERFTPEERAEFEKHMRKTDGGG